VVGHPVIPLRSCALGSGAGFCENTVLVMRPDLRGGANPILPHARRQKSGFGHETVFLSAAKLKEITVEQLDLECKLDRIGIRP
jgi:hypothetical protein